MNRIFLHGSMKEFGSMYELDVSTVREAFVALCSQIEGFEQRVRDGAFRIVRRKIGSKEKIGLDEVLLDLNADGCRFDIYPAMVGGKSGIGKILLGVAIVGLTIATSGAGTALLAGNFAAAGAAMAGGAFLGVSFGTIAAFGAMVAFGGMAMMFSPAPKAPKAGAGAKDDGSFILSGPVNSMAQGGPVQLPYGRFLVGSTVISSSMTIEQLIAGRNSGAVGSGTGTNIGPATGAYDYTKAWQDEGYDNYPYATGGVGGSGVGGERVLNDVSSV